VEELEACLQAGERVGLHERTHDVNLQMLLQRARDLITEFSEIHQNLVEVLTGINRNPNQLRQISMLARTKGLPSGSVDLALCDECDRLVKIAEEELIPSIQSAILKAPEVNELNTLLGRCLDEGLGGMSELDKIRTWISMDSQRYLQEQLRCASANKDKIHLVEITIRLRGVYLETHGSEFRLDKYVDLREPTEWCGKTRFGTSSKRLRMGMLSWSATPIHAPLTKRCRDDVNLKRLALRASHIMLKYMGGNQHETTPALYEDVQEEEKICDDVSLLLMTCLAEHSLRDEVYLQLCKQLTGNSNVSSVQRGWNLLALCLLTFPPSSSFDYFLEQFIRSRAISKEDYATLLDKLHLSLFGGERPSAPNSKEVFAVRNDGANLQQNLGWRVIDTRIMNKVGG
jgi:hypothetical protein